jgi:lipid A 4'-phosphatase
MDRTGLVAALLVGFCVGVVFGVYPQFDIAISRQFFDETMRVFPAVYSLLARHMRDVFNWTTALLVAPSFVALIVKIVLPRRRMFMSARAAIFLIATLALAPGVMANLVLKENWNRPRPNEVMQFDGPDKFVPWWDPRGTCEKNCSFVAGEGAGAFWAFAPASLAPPAWRPAAYTGAILFGLAAGGLRVSGGAHFFSDVMFSGVFTFLIVWLMHGLIYRWRRTRITDEQVEAAIERVALPPHLWLMRSIGRS